MTRFIFILLLLSWSMGSSSKLPLPPVSVGIVTSNSFSTGELVRDIFLKNGCKNVDNIKSINNGLAVGYFEGAGNVFGFNEGIILSSGAIELAEGPNEDIESTWDYNAHSDDPDMNVFSPNNIYDVGGIEFDFVPVGSRVTFDYAFASEEYCEFVGSVFNDVFGFFVSGPGINGSFSNGAINVALLPNNDFVAINSVNHLTNSGLYIKNERMVEANECIIPFDQQFPEEIEYDGMTVKLTAAFDVIPCETYYIRLLVADVGDAILDSGVFLAAKTFDINSDVNVMAKVDGSVDAIAVEDCQDGQFVFTRSAINIDQDQIVYFSINQNSTAESGLDYVPLPDSIIIPAGQTSFSLPVELIGDMLIEAEETLILEMAFPCNCINPLAATLYIRDRDPLAVEPEEITVCAGQPFTIDPILTGGIEPYSYLWDNGTVGSILATTISSATTFLVTVTESCGTSDIGTYTALTQAVPSAVLSGEASYCEGTESFLEITFEGQAPWTVQYTIDNDLSFSLSDLTENPFLLPVDAAGEYELIFFTDAFCVGEASGKVTVGEADSLLSYTVTPSSCFKFADGEITLSLDGGSPPFEVVWAPPVNDDFNPTGLLSGLYSVTIVDQSGCVFGENIEVPSIPSNSPDCERFTMYIPNSFSPNFDGINDEFRLFPNDDSNIALIRSLHIFNRWGAIVYEKKDFQPAAEMPLWNGTFKGKLMDGGVFVWQLNMELEDGGTELLAGDLVLMR